MLLSNSMDCATEVTDSTANYYHLIRMLLQCQAITLGIKLQTSVHKVVRDKTRNKENCQLVKTFTKNTMVTF